MSTAMYIDLTADHRLVDDWEMGGKASDPIPIDRIEDEDMGHGATSSRTPFRVGQSGILGAGRGLFVGAREHVTPGSLLLFSKHGRTTCLDCADLLPPDVSEYAIGMTRLDLVLDVVCHVRVSSRALRDQTNLFVPSECVTAFAGSRPRSLSRRLCARCSRSIDPGTDSFVYVPMSRSDDGKCLASMANDLAFDAGDDARRLYFERMQRNHCVITKVLVETEDGIDLVPALLFKRGADDGMEVSVTYGSAYWST